MHGAAVGAGDRHGDPASRVELGRVHAAVAAPEPVDEVGVEARVEQVVVVGGGQRPRLRARAGR
jgi:hypothetical protein